MKRLFAIVLSICLVFALCGCGSLDKISEIELPPLPIQTPAPTTAVTPEPSAEPEISKEEVSTAPECMIIVNTINTSLEEYDPAEGKELILSFSYDTPVVHIEGRDDASAKINDVIAMLDETHYTGNDHGMGIGTGGFNMMLEQAQDNYAYVVNSGVQGVSLEFTASRSANIERADSKVLTIVYDDYYYTGGAHGIYFSRGYNFDTETGEKLSLEMLSNDFEGLKSYLVETMLDMAEKSEDISQRIDELIIPVEARSEAFAALIREGSWYFDNDGLCIFSDVYELGSYAAGEIEFHIPYEQLEGKIIDKYIPEKRSGEASLSISHLEDIQNGSTEIIDRVVADEDGEELCISVDGTAFDVKLSKVDYTDRFFETAQLWYASYMENSALQVVTTVPEGMPHLMFSYCDAEGVEHNLLISQSGADGSLLLVDDDIEAVG